MKIRTLKYLFLCTITIAFFSTSCEKVQLPDPTIDNTAPFNLKGFINKDSFEFSTERYYLKTDFFNDELGIRVFESSFIPLEGSDDPSIILRIRDNDIYSCCYDKAHMLKEGSYRFSKIVAAAGDALVLKNSLLDQDLIGYRWQNGHTTFNGNNYYVENLNPNLKIKVCIESHELLSNGILEYCKELYPSQLQDNFDISVKDFRFNGNKIEIVFEKPVSGNLTYNWGGENFQPVFKPDSSGVYELFLSNSKSQVNIKFRVNISQDSDLIPFEFPAFSTEMFTFTGFPSFSQCEIIYINPDGQIYSTRHTKEQHSVFEILKSEYLDKRDDLNNMLQLLEVDFSCKLYSESGDSMSLDRVRGPYPVAFEQ
jgi:hypothetical protein